MSPRQRAVRDEPVPLDAHVLRGLAGPAGLPRAELAAAARANLEVYGFWGVSGWVAAATGNVDPLLRGWLARFEHVATYRSPTWTLPDLSSSRPRRPTATSSSSRPPAPPLAKPGDLEVLLDQMLSAPHTESDNPYVDGKERADDPHRPPRRLELRRRRGLNLARVPAAGEPAAGAVLVAGTPTAWFWAVVADVADGWVRFRPVTAREAARHEGRQLRQAPAK